MCFFLSDYGKFKWPHAIWNLLYFLGCLSLIAATVGLIPFHAVITDFERLPVLFSLVAVLCIIAFLLLIYTLFFALPFGGTYLKNSTDQTKLVSSGVYSLCRHPGVLAYSICYLLLVLLVRSDLMILAAALFILLNVLYVTWQDIFLFPKTIAGYGDYKKSVPFLLPNRESVKRFLKGRKKG